MGSHLGVGAPPILVYFSGDWDVHWGYALLTHGHIRLLPLPEALFDEDERGLWIDTSMLRKEDDLLAPHPVPNIWACLEIGVPPHNTRTHVFGRSKNRLGWGS